MAALPAADPAVPAYLSSFVTEKIIRCIELFRDAKCLKTGHEAQSIITFDDLDEQKMKAHIMDSVAALGFVQRSHIAQGKPELPETTQAASNRIFTKAVTSMLNDVLIYEEALAPLPSEAMGELLYAFPDSAKLTDGRGWLPLHWGMITENVSEADVKLIYSSDPLALRRYHLQGSGINLMGFTPGHLLCMKEMTNRNMSLVRKFSCLSQGNAFTMSADYPERGDPSLYSFTALHAACCLGKPTVDLIQYLLQLDSKQTKKMCSAKGTTPLGYIIKNSNGTEPILMHLMEVDSSTAVIWSAINGCLLPSSDYSRVLDRVEMLLKADPEAAKHRSLEGANLLHMAAQQVKFSQQICIDVMQRIVAIHKDAVREVPSQGWLPIHFATRYSTLDVMEFLLGLYPESASMVTTDGSLNLLRLAVSDKENTPSVMEAKVCFLCSQYPAMMLQRDSHGSTPLISAIINTNISAMHILCKAGGQELVRMPLAHPTDAEDILNGRLPLHFLICYCDGVLRDSLLSKEADMFRTLLQLYPEAAAIEGGIGIHRRTPYQRALDYDLPSYYRRLLLRAVPNLNPAELRRLNYEERRMALFLVFRAETGNPEPSLLTRLRFGERGGFESLLQAPPRP